MSRLSEWLGHKERKPQVTIIDDIESVLQKHRAGVEQDLADAAKVAANPVAVQIAGLAHIPPGALQLLGAFAARLDDEFAKAQPTITPMPTQGTVLPPPGIQAGASPSASNG
jgi:hypothetical protein